MPSFPITVQDTSPLIRYSANWDYGDSQGDRYLDQYSMRTFMLCQNPGDAMTFKFYGTGATVYGARRVNHGSYSGQMDGGSSSTFNGKESPPVFGQAMYKVTAAPGDHEITMTNGDGYFDVDYITFNTTIGTEEDELIINTFQDNHPSFVYTPASSWRIPEDSGMYSGSSIHVTKDNAATARFTFRGNFTDGYSVQIDNVTTPVYSANKQVYKPQELLFFAGNLGVGEHTLQIQFSSAALGELAIDYATVYIGTASPNVVTIETSHSNTPRGVIAGLAVTSVVAFLATLACMYLMLRQRGMIRADRKPHPIPPEISVTPQPQGSITSFMTPLNASYTVGGQTPPSPSDTIASPISHGFSYQPQGKRHLGALQVPGASSMAEVDPPRYTTVL
ncbi:hypothetical protein D9613_000220 [Agrocybe pediades]|uniref:Transmembrane protein n=1 Tax=Agrocybe pediades TaxID=84607 RepID=A0A8H4R0T2_9AGAR|nr:hypothetical protein D9613_000220 [Agrocybe pediades]